MSHYLASNNVLLTNFGSHVERVSAKLKTASLAEALAADRPVRYLASSSVSKEKIAQQIATKDAITAGLVSVLTCVEPAARPRSIVTAPPGSCACNPAFANACSCTTTAFTPSSAC